MWNTTFATEHGRCGGALYFVLGAERHAVTVGTFVVDLL